MTFISYHLGIAATIFFFSYKYSDKKNENSENVLIRKETVGNNEDKNNI